MGDEFTTSRLGLYSSDRAAASERRGPQSRSASTKGMSTTPRRSARFGLSIPLRSRCLGNRAVARMASTASSSSAGA